MNNPITDSADREKAIRLVDYLTRIALLRSKVVRNVDDYQSVLWLNDVPIQKGCFTQAWGRDENHDSDIWVEIQRPNEPELPTVPDLCKDWVKIESLRNTSDLPEILPEITVLIDNPDWSEDSEQPEIIPHTKRLEDYPEVQKAWDSYVESKWLDWAADYKAWASIYKVYSQLFAIRQELNRLGEEFELILALGLLIWRSPTGQLIRRHLLVADAMLEFESNSGKFTLKPSTEGAKLRPELEMLDAQELPSNAETIAMQELNDNDDPWERNVVGGVLKALVHSFGTQGQFSDSLIATDMPFGDNPVVVYAPALILRKRSAKGLTNTLQRIREQIETGEGFLGEFRGLAEIPPMDDEHVDGVSYQKKLEFDGEVLFPKPWNEEQRLIVDKIQTTSGVLVQGPPGTGKSHTIANLICHLLATGQRILITAKTTRALEVLKELVPEELRFLCINLIDGGLGKGGSLESSVKGIHLAHDNWNQDRSSLECEKLERNLRQLREEKAKVDRRLRDIREAETQSRSLAEGAYPGTAAEIAEAVNRDRNTYKWFTDDVTEDSTCPTSDGDLRKILKALRHFTPEKRQEIELELPSALPSATQWEEFVENELNATEEENSARNGADERVADMLSSRTGTDIKNIRDAFNQFLDMRRNLMALAYSWMEEAIRDAITGNTDSWRQVLEVTKHTLTTIEPLVEAADNTELSDLTDINLRALHEAAHQLEIHLEEGGKIKWWQFPPEHVKAHLKLTKTVLVNGKQCLTLRDFSDLAKASRVRIECEKAWGFWLGRAEKSQGPYRLQMHELKRLGESLEKALSLETLTKKCRDIVRQYPAIGEPVWFDELQVETVVASCRLALAQQHKRECEREIRKIENPIASLAAKSNAHPLTSKLYHAIRERSTDRFAIIANDLRDLRDEQERVRKLDMRVSAMRQHMPKVMDELVRTCNDPSWDNRLGKIEYAWRWAYARYWVEDFISQEDTPALTRRAKQTEDEINAAIAQLAALRAWSFCFSRLTEYHRQHMEAWNQAMRRYGKGTGKHAAYNLRTAQQHLDQCYEAVPAWVMPLHRVWDAVRPAPGMFDVVIVDEASQCGIEAMPLFYLGKKILIVGDDKQISPESVGLPRDAVHGLIDSFLDDFDFKSSFNVESSIFDHGKLRYGAQHITLREHFRCMPEIIRFSDNLCYSATPLIPLRQYGPDRIAPLKRKLVNGGYRERSGHRVINRPEADEVVKKIVELCNDSTGRYDDKTMGVVVLQGTEQARLIETQLLDKLGAKEIERRRLICGNPYDFQGDERDIIFLSMVAATVNFAGDKVNFRSLTGAADERRFNVAASRAKDQMYLFHSVRRDDLSPKCLRRRLLEFFENRIPQEIAGINREELERGALQENRSIVSPPPPFESWFELDVALEIARKGYKVIPQHQVAKKRIDLVIEGGNARLAVECDGDNWHGPDQYEEDMHRQRQLERCGWVFFRVRQSAFYLNRERTLQGLWRALEERDIVPTEFISTNSPQRMTHGQKRESEFKEISRQPGPPKQNTDRLIQLRLKREKQVKAVNDHPLNQMALELLKKVGAWEDSDPPYLHSLRLLSWRLLQNPKLEDEEILGQELSRLLDLQPEKALQELLRSPDQEPTGALARLNGAKTPEQGASVLIDVVMTNLMANPMQELVDRS